jgi:flagellin-like protein
MLNLNIKKDRGLSNVVATLILLVVTVLLTAIVTHYATNVTMTRTSIENVRISNVHIWVNNSGAVEAFKLQNLGGRDILIDKFSVRGIDSDWSDMYYYRVPSGITINGDLNITSFASLAGPFVIIDGRNYTQADSDIPLISGGELLCYVRDPDNVQLDDVGTTVSISVTTTNAPYINECIVKSGETQ